MKSLTQWAHAHPFKACTFTSLFIFAGALWEDCDWRFAAAVTFAVWIVFELAVRVDLKRLAPILVIMALATSVRADEPIAEPAPLLGRAVAAAIIVGGTWAAIKIRNFCKRKFPRTPPNTNAPPEEMSSERGALFTWTEEGYCIEERTLTRSTPVVVTLSILVSRDNPTVTTTASIGDEYVEDWAGFVEDMAAHGLSVPDMREPQAACFERGRVACEPWEAGISIDWRTKTIRNGEGGILVTVERSYDLLTWTTLVKYETAETLLVLDDATAEGSAFYRTTLSR